MFYKKTITYFDFEGMIYWTLGAAVENTTIINSVLKFLIK